jgi:hypothetical protein
MKTQQNNFPFYWRWSHYVAQVVLQLEILSEPPKYLYDKNILLVFLLLEHV